LAVLADQRRGQAFLSVDEIPCELAFDAGGNAVDRGFLHWLHFQYLAPARPHLERAAHAAIRAHRLGALDFLLPQGDVDLGNGRDWRCAGRVLQRFDEVDHRALGVGLDRGERAGIRLQRALQQRIARAYSDAVAAGDAARLADRFAGIPQHARVRAVVVDAQRFVDFDVLARLHAAAAQDALIRVVGVERIGFVFVVWFSREFVALDGDVHVGEGVVQLAVAGVVFAYRAIQLMLGEEAVHRFLARFYGVGRIDHDNVARMNHGGAAAHQFSVDLHHAGIAGLKRPKRFQVADVRNVDAQPCKRAQQALSRSKFAFEPIDKYVAGVVGHGKLGLSAVIGACACSISASMPFCHRRRMRCG